MAKLPSSLQRVINELSKLPGVGPKTAQRLGFYLLKRENIDITNLSTAIAQVKQGVNYCSVCHMMADTDPCAVDADPKRDHSLICVVEETLDALAIDKAGEYNGVFHVLGGVLNPLEGIGPGQLTIDHLVERIKNQETRTKEVIIATNPSLEGETTSMHLHKAIKEANPEVKITRIARGLPMGGDLEYADDITLMRAMEGRREY
jgi:recombination protein RecR